MSRQEVMPDVPALAKRDPNKYYYLVPNEVFNLGLSSHEIAVYNYLLRCEDRRPTSAIPATAPSERRCS